MAVELIADLDDPRLDPFRNLPRRKSSRTTTEVIVEGRWLVQRLVASPFPVESIVCLPRLAEELVDIARDIPILSAEKSLIEQLVGFDFHRGILACGRRPASPKLHDVVGEFRERSLLAICVGVCDPANLGGVIRTSAALGITALIIDPASADPYSRRTLRVSMGTALSLPIVESANLADDLAQLHNDFGFEISAAVVNDRAVRLSEAHVAQRAAVVFGNEGFGVDQQILQRCQHQVTLPMQGNVDSLNIAVASGIFLNHFATAQSFQQSSG